MTGDGKRGGGREPRAGVTFTLGTRTFPPRAPVPTLGRKERMSEKPLLVSDFVLLRNLTARQLLPLCEFDSRTDGVEIIARL